MPLLFDADIFVIFTRASCEYQLKFHTPEFNEKATVNTLDKAIGYVKVLPPIPPCLNTNCYPEEPLRFPIGCTLKTRQ